MLEKRLFFGTSMGRSSARARPGSRAIARATAERFEGGDLGGVEIAGRTDLGIAHQILTKYGAPLTDQSVRLLARPLCRIAGRTNFHAGKAVSCREFWSCSSTRPKNPTSPSASSQAIWSAAPG